VTKTIIFDFDGTIADTFSSSIEIINSLANKFGFKKFENEEIEKLRSKNMQDIVKEFHIPFFKLPSMINSFTSLAQKTIPSQRPVNNISLLLKELKVMVII
jgi:phosphoglycolate phosphatase